VTRANRGFGSRWRDGWAGAARPSCLDPATLVAEKRPAHPWPLRAQVRLGKRLGITRQQARSLHPRTQD